MLDPRASGWSAVRVAEASAEPAATHQAADAALAQQLDKARTDLETMKAELADERGAAARERARSAVLRQNFLTLRQEIDVLRNTVETAGNAREETLRRDLAATRKELDDMRQAEGAARANAGADANLAAMQKQALEEERERAEGLAGDLVEAQREIERLKAGATTQAADIAEETRRALDQKRRELWLLTHDRAGHPQSTGSPEIGARQPAVAESSVQDGTGVASKQAGKDLARERKKAESVARDLEAARRERDAAKQELAQVSAALEQERNKSADLAREHKSAGSAAHDLETAHRERDAAKDELAKVSAALQQERNKSADLARKRESADSAAHELETARQERDAAKQDLARVSAALEQERNKIADLAREHKSADSAAHDLEIAHRERDAAKDELAKVSAALQEERNKAADLAREVVAAHDEIEAIKGAAPAPRSSSIDNVPKPRAADRPKARANASVKTARRPAPPQTVSTQARKPPRSLRLSNIELPNALLPTPPASGESQ
jgi:chromosome segregation ATPase